MAEEKLEYNKTLKNKLAVAKYWNFMGGFYIPTYNHAGNNYKDTFAPMGGDVLGTLTGYFTVNGWYEVILFNPVYKSANAEVTYVVMAYGSDYDFIDDSPKLKLPVYKFHYGKPLSDNHWKHFWPDVNPHYIADGATPQLWDNKYGNVDFIENYYKAAREYYLTGSNFETNTTKFVGYGGTEYDKIDDSTRQNQNDISNANPGGKASIYAHVYASLVTDTSVRVKSDGIAYANAGATRKGFVIAKHAHPLVEYDTVFESAGYDTVITGLLPNTKYYIRAFVTTGDLGSNYSNNVIIITNANSGITAPKIETIPSKSIEDTPLSIIYVGNVTHKSFNVGMKVFSDGGSPMLEFGYCYGTTNNPDASGTKFLYNETITENGAISIHFDTLGYRGGDNILPLTKYYIRAYAKNHAGLYSYGEECEITTLYEGAKPTFIVDPVYDITSDSFKVHVKVTDQGGAKLNTGNDVITVSVFQPSYDKGVTGKTSGSSDDFVFEFKPGPPGSYFSPIKPDTEYFIKVHVPNIYGSNDYTSDTFRTLAADVTDVLPTVSVMPASVVRNTSAVLQGSVVVPGGTITNRGLVWGITSGPTIALPTKTDSGPGSASMNAQLTGLTPGVKYYFRTYATNAAGTAYSAELNFTTSVDNEIKAPTLSDLVLTSVSGATASVRSSVTNDGGSSITERGLCWNTSGNPTVTGSNKMILGGQIGDLLGTISKLSQNQVIYVRAYAKNIIGYSYSTELMVTTNSVPQLTTNIPYLSEVGEFTCGGNISSAGGPSMDVTKRGLVWSQDSNPTVKSLGISSNGTGVGSFSQVVTGLSEGTWHIRAYAENSIGVGYGNEQSVIVAKQDARVVSSSYVNSAVNKNGIIHVEVEVRSTNVGIVLESGVKLVLSTNSSVTKTVKSQQTSVGTFSLIIGDIPQTGTYNVFGYITIDGITTTSTNSIPVLYKGLGSSSAPKAPETPIIGTVYEIGGVEAVYDGYGYVRPIISNDSQKFAGMTAQEYTAYVQSIMNTNATGVEEVMLKRVAITSDQPAIMVLGNDDKFNEVVTEIEGGKMILHDEGRVGIFATYKNIGVHPITIEDPVATVNVGETVSLLSMISPPEWKVAVYTEAKIDMSNLKAKHIINTGLFVTYVSTQLRINYASEVGDLIFVGIWDVPIDGHKYIGLYQTVGYDTQEKQSILRLLVAGTKIKNISVEGKGLYISNYDGVNINSLVFWNATETEQQVVNINQPLDRLPQLFYRNLEADNTLPDSDIAGRVRPIETSMKLVAIVGSDYYISNVPYIEGLVKKPGDWMFGFAKGDSSISINSSIRIVTAEYVGDYSGATNCCKLTLVKASTCTVDHLCFITSFLAGGLKLQWDHQFKASGTVGTWNSQVTVIPASWKCSDGTYRALVGGFSGSAGSGRQYIAKAFSATDRMGTWTNISPAGLVGEFDDILPVDCNGYTQFNNAIPHPLKKGTFIMAIGLTKTTSILNRLAILEFDEYLEHRRIIELTIGYTPVPPSVFNPLTYGLSIGFYKGEYLISIHDGSVATSGKRVVLKSKFIEGSYNIHSTIFDFAVDTWMGKKGSFGDGAMANSFIFPYGNELYCIAIGQSTHIPTGLGAKHQAYLWKYNDADDWTYVKGPIILSLHGDPDNYPEYPKIGDRNVALIDTELGGWGSAHLGSTIFHYVEGNKLWLGYDAKGWGQNVGSTYQGTMGYIDLGIALQ